MKLRKIELESFRAFQSASIDIPESGLVLVAGVISAGKSALLSTFDVIAFGEQPAERKNYKSSSAARIAATFTLDDNERERVLGSASDESLLPNGAFREVTWEYSDQFGTGLGASELRATWPHLGDVTLARVATRGRTRQVTTEIKDVLAVLGVPFAVQAHTGDINALKAAVNSTALHPLVEFLSNWSEGLYHFKALRPGTSGDTYPGRADAKLAPSGENLPAVLNGLYHNRREVFEELKTLVQRIVPGIGELQLPQQDTSIRVCFSDPSTPNSTLNLKSLGTGVEQLLMTLVVGLTGEGPTGIILEEPETNLHPGAQRALLALIREWSATRPFIIATHSPVFLDAGQRAEVVLVTRQAGISQVRSLGTQSLEAR